jgi:DNA-binding CsgD family transcriptional regulator
MRKRRDYLGVLEAAYAVRCDELEWVTGIARAMCPILNQGLGVIVYTYDAHAGPTLELGPLGQDGTECWLPRLATTFAMGLSAEEARRVYAGRRPVESLSSIQGDFPLREEALNVIAAREVPDALGVRAHNPEQRSVLILACSRVRCRVPGPRQRAALNRIAAHVAAAARLRLSGAAEPDDADAVLSVAGRLEHLAIVDDGNAPSVLPDAVRSRSMARKLRREDPARALQLWQALVAGRWSLVDHEDRDGRRFVLARRNASNVREPAALTPNERLAALYAVSGHPNSLVAYELGLSPSTTSVLLRSAMRKLRVKSVAELAQLFAKKPEESSLSRDKA